MEYMEQNWISYWFRDNDSEYFDDKDIKIRFNPDDHLLFKKRNMNAWCCDNIRPAFYDNTKYYPHVILHEFL